MCLRLSYNKEKMMKSSLQSVNIFIVNTYFYVIKQFLLKCQMKEIEQQNKRIPEISGKNSKKCGKHNKTSIQARKNE